MPKSAEIQTEIDNKNALIDQEAAKGQQTNHEYIIQLRGEITQLETQLSTAKTEEAKQHDAQAQAAQIGGLKETMRSIFEAAFPKDETVKLIGLTEYETTQQTYNQLTDQAIDEDQSTLYAAFKAQLEQRDEKYRVLTLQALDVQNQLDKANGTIQTQAETITAHEKEIEELHNDASLYSDELHQKDIEIESLGQQLENAKETIFSLQKQINNVPTTPQVIDITPTKPSESLADKIAQAKAASVKQFSNLYSEVTYTDGTKQVVHNSLVPNLEIPVLPTPEPVASQNVEQSAHSEQVIHPSENEIPSTQPEADSSAVGNQPVVEVVAKTAEEKPVTRAEHEALAARVATIERHANIQAVA